MSEQCWVQPKDKQLWPHSWKFRVVEGSDTYFLQRLPRRLQRRILCWLPHDRIKICPVPAVYCNSSGRGRNLVLKPFCWESRVRFLFSESIPCARPGSWITLGAETSKWFVPLPSWDSWPLSCRTSFVPSLSPSSTCGCVTACHTQQERSLSTLQPNS